MKTYESLLASGVEELKGSGVPEADINAWYLLAWSIAISRDEAECAREAADDTGVHDEDLSSAEYVCKVSGLMPDRSWYILHSGDESDAGVAETFIRLIGYRKKGCPLEYITHYTEFMGLPIYVEPSVLIPRQDTECLVEEALKHSEGKRVLDICTGSGCIAVSIAKLGKPESVTATDKSGEALKVAGINAELNGVDITFFNGDMWEALDTEKGTENSFDLITCNPPYIRRGEIPELMREVCEYEPMMALDGGDDGLYFYRKLAERAGHFLSEKGRLIMEIGCDQAEEVSELFRAQGYMNIRVIKDLAGLDRVVEVW